MAIPHEMKALTQFDAAAMYDAPRSEVPLAVK